MKNIKYIALLRGINVGGHHKVPMAELRKEMENIGFTNVITLLNTGNIIFESQETVKLENKIEVHLQNAFGFPIPTIVINQEEIATFVNSNPFENIELTENTRLYVSFLKNKPKVKVSLPYISDDNSFNILSIKNKVIFSTLDLSIGKTVRGMNDLERLFGKEITTRNWNTIIKLSKK